MTNEPNRYLYNGKERIDDLDIGWYDYGARMYMPEIGRWNTIDPLGEKYPSQSLFSYVGNNPLVIVDPDGRELQVRFDSQEAIDLYKNIINKVFNNQFKLTFSAVKDDEGNKTGYYKIGVKATKDGGDVSKLSKGAQSFYKNFTKITDHDNVVKMNIVFDKNDVHTGHYDKKAIDMADVSQWPEFDNSKDEQNGASQAGKIIHETAEQFISTYEGENVASAHRRALAYENSTNGNTRNPIDKRAKDEGVIQSFRLQNGTVVKYQVIGGQYSTIRGTLIIKPIKK